MKKAEKKLLVDPNLRESLRIPEAITDGGDCVGANPRYFDGETLRAITKAKAICAECPVKDLCMQWAMDNEAHGVWGGTTPEEREALGGVLAVPYERRVELAELQEAVLGNREVREYADDFDLGERQLHRVRKEVRAAMYGSDDSKAS